MSGGGPGPVVFGSPIFEDIWLKIKTINMNNGPAVSAKEKDKTVLEQQITELEMQNKVLSELTYRAERIGLKIADDQQPENGLKQPNDTPTSYPGHLTNLSIAVEHYRSINYRFTALVEKLEKLI